MFDTCSASSSVRRGASCEAFVDWWYSTIYWQETRAYCSRSERSLSTFEMSTDSSSRACRHLWNYLNSSLSKIFSKSFICFSHSPPYFYSSQSNRETRPCCWSRLISLSFFILNWKYYLCCFIYLFIFRSKIEFKVGRRK